MLYSARLNNKALGSMGAVLYLWFQRKHPDVLKQLDSPAPPNQPAVTSFLTDLTPKK